MKTITKFLLATILLPLLTACSWLDVDSDTYILEEDLFAKEEGYFSALNGVYKLVSNNTLYSHNLTKGIPTILSGFYSEMSFSRNDGYEEVNLGELESKDIDDLSSIVWSAAYKAIANCNNIIKHAEAADASIFEEGHKDMIIGEAMALRAMLHFDMLTIYAPAKGAEGADQKRMPYVDAFPTHQPGYLTVQEFLDKVITDLEAAQEMLKTMDVTLYPEAMSLENKLSNFMIPSDKLQVSIRGTHLNYYAASVLLCRAYTYNEDYDKAEALAKELYACGPDGSGSKLFSFTDVTDFELKHSDDILFATYDAKQMEFYESCMAGSYTLNVDVISELFDGQTEYDIRYTKLVKLVEGKEWWQDDSFYSKRWALGTEDEPTSDFEYALTPIVRFSEVYHILALCYAKQNRVDDAMTILNQIRQHRGKMYTGADEFGTTINRPYMPLVSVTSAEEAVYEISREYARESLDEGRAYWMFKSTGYDTEKVTMLNLPSVEIEYMTL